MMAIYYHKEFGTKYGESNFGDDINPYLLKKHLPKEIYESSSKCVVGIGTLLNNSMLDHIKDYKEVIVFTSGVGYGDITELLNHKKIVYAAVRGPLSAEKLKLNKDLAITDGAILLSQEFKDKKTIKFNYTFIPHINTHWSSGHAMKDICESLNINYLPPNADLFDFMKVVRQSELVITEAMHGAILADSLRTPWIPIRILNALEFKWQDWATSMSIDYAPHEFIELFDPKNNLSSKIKSKLKSVIFKKKLKTILRKPSYLSSEQVFESKLSQIISLSKMENFRNL